MLSFLYGFCEQRSVEKSKTEEKQRAVFILPYPTQLVLQKRLETQDCYVRVFTLHWSSAKTDVRRPRKDSFRVELVSQLTFPI